MKSKKTTLFLSILALLLVVGCKKIVPPTEESKALFGDWAYRFSSGGFAGTGGSTRFEQGDWVKFTDRGGFCVYNGSKKKRSERYQIELKESIFSSTPIPAIVYKNKQFETFYIVHDTLTIQEEGTDSYVYQFVRK